MADNADAVARLSRTDLITSGTALVSVYSSPLDSEAVMDCSAYSAAGRSNSVFAVGSSFLITSTILMIDVFESWRTLSETFGSSSPRRLKTSGSTPLASCRQLVEKRVRYRVATTGRMVFVAQVGPESINHRIP